MKSKTLKALIGGSLATVMAVSISLPVQANAAAAGTEVQTFSRYEQIVKYFQTYYGNVTPTIANNTTVVTKPAAAVVPQKSAAAAATRATKKTAVAAPASTKLTYTQQVVALVNKERAAAGLNAVMGLDSLNKVAAAKATDMRTNKYFSHTSPTYGSPFEMMSDFGITYKAAGENIAMGQKTPEEVMKAWMNSPGHRSNILSKNFNYIGVGFDNNYWVQEFVGK
ncbi:CAP domain-containing protein [Paenibacillus sp. BR2-3]|uniref:CAP domain-containing protein n=1 Tax=Paenibacillus sp. BR2-3 TaxID=3048494 RepID=UPI003977CC19